MKRIIARRRFQNNPIIQKLRALREPKIHPNLLSDTVIITRKVFEPGPPGEPVLIDTIRKTVKIVGNQFLGE